MAQKFAPQDAPVLESPERRAAMPPERTLRHVGLQRGMTFLDAGAGTGYFALPAAELVGPSGKVLALDVQPEMLARLREKRPPPWVELHLSEESRFPLADGVADLAFACFVLHEVHDPVAFLQELGRVARRRARIVVLEWARRRQREGPPFEERLHHHRTEALVLEAGLAFRSVEFLNPSQYVVTAFRK